MKLIDKNETLVHPKGELTGVLAEGAYLRLTYQEEDDTVTDVFLNDQGREVLRNSWVVPKIDWSLNCPDHMKDPQSWWQRLVAGFKRGE